VAYLLFFIPSFCWAVITSTPAVNSVCQLSDNTTNAIYILHLNETGWDGTAGEIKDSSGNGNNGYAVNVTNTETNAKFGKAVLFDAGNEYFYIPDSTPSITADWTIMFWCKFQTVSDVVGYLFDKHIPGDSGIYFYMADATPNHDITIGFTSSAGSEEHASVTPALNDNTMRHIAFTHNSSNNTLASYVNGVKYFSVVTTNDHTAMPALGKASKIGSSHATRHLNGTVDEFAIINGVWSAEQIKAYYYKSPHRD